VLAQHAPDALLVHISQAFGDQRGVPARITRGRRLAGPPSVVEPVEALVRKSGSAKLLTTASSTPMVRKIERVLTTTQWHGILDNEFTGGNCRCPAKRTRSCSLSSGKSLRR
jgi:hypothetical protein